ncbi:MAG: KEOPS complex subunit Pcc1 [Methanomicrobiaceae archaeon]|nr:KEOPS complex subunit Pcc1 [Methanomicrobiaceae archaeon]
MNIAITGTIRTAHEKPECVAAALRADNLRSMVTGTEQGMVRTTIGGAQLRSIIASVDDYLMNLAISEDLCQYSLH